MNTEGYTMNINVPTEGELALALQMFRALNQENRDFALALLEVMQESPGTNDDSRVSAS